MLRSSVEGYLLILLDAEAFVTLLWHRFGAENLNLHILDIRFTNSSKRCFETQQNCQPGLHTGEAATGVILSVTKNDQILPGLASQL
jgi:hypothetical protein